MNQPALELDALVVGKAGIAAVGPVSLTIGPGEIMALLGPNGAGKSTLLRALIGLAPRLSGSIRINGATIPLAARPQAFAALGVGYAPQGRRVFPGLTAAENLHAASDLPKPAREADLAEVFALFPRLAERRRSEAWRLSGGEQQMLAIGRALMRRPRLLLLDEPSLGLAPIVIDGLFHAIEQIRDRGVATLLAEQSVRRALDIADQAAVMARGRITTLGAPDDVRADPLLVDSYLG